MIFRPLSDYTQHTQGTDIHAPGGIRTHNPNKRAAADPRLRPRGKRVFSIDWQPVASFSSVHWGWPSILIRSFMPSKVGFEREVSEWRIQKQVFRNLYKLYRLYTDIRNGATIDPRTLQIKSYHWNYVLPDDSTLVRKHVGDTYITPTSI